VAKAKTASAAPAILTKSGYAAHRGVTPAQVTHWHKAGRIALTADGRVDVRKSDAMLASNTDPARGGKGGRPAWHAGKPAAAPAGARDAGDDAPEVVPSATFQEARTRRERVAADAAELELARKRGALVERAAYDRALLDALGPIVAQLDALGPNLAPLVSATSDLRELQTIIDREVVKVRQGIVDALRHVASAG
jgi:hypothetical protein